MAPQRDVDALVRDFVAGRVGDDAMTDWLRDVCAHGLSDEDTYALTIAMARSGEILDWSGVGGPVVDKHSTGGVGDDVSLVAVPLAAACGVKVAKLSGRALGHTGGTIDKLECIPGIRTTLSAAEIRAQLATIGCAIAAASATLAPADKRLYALRHHTNTVASIPLIASSIMSKKIAGGAAAIVLDVKSGAGAFMTHDADARSLARTMREIGRRAGKRVATIVTRMDDPLANSVGDALELDEALSVLEGRGGSSALREAALIVARTMVAMAGVAPAQVDRALASGAGRESLSRMAAAQGGRVDEFDRTWGASDDIIADRAGFVAQIDARRLGDVVAKAKVAANDERRAGVRLLKRRGDRVEPGETIAKSWLSGDRSVIRDLIAIAPSPPAESPLVLEIVQAGDVT